MEDSVVTTRSLQWEQRILTVATSKFEKEQISNIQLNSGILNILFKIYLSPHRVTRKGHYVCNSYLCRKCCTEHLL